MDSGVDGRILPDVYGFRGNIKLRRSIVSRYRDNNLDNFCAVSGQGLVRCLDIQLQQQYISYDI